MEGNNKYGPQLLLIGKGNFLSGKNLDSLARKKMSIKLNNKENKLMRYSYYV